MSNIINFNSVGNGNNSDRKTVQPGVDVFTIEEGEVKTNTNGKVFLALKFVNKEGKYLKEQFYATTPGTLARIKELATNSGVTLGEDTLEQVVAKLLGTKVGLVVGGEKENAEFDGKSQVVTRARLKNAYNFSFRANELEKWKDSKIIIEDKTIPETATATTSTVTDTSDDLPF